MGMGVMGLGNGLDMYVCRHVVVGQVRGLGVWITWWTLWDWGYGTRPTRRLSTRVPTTRKTIARAAARRVTGGR